MSSDLALDFAGLPTDINQVFDVVHAGKSIRSVVTY